MAAITRKQTTRRGPKRDLEVYYVVELSDWDWSFSFGVSNVPHIDHEPFSDYRHLTLEGKLLRPAKLKADKAEVTLLLDARLNRGQREKHEPRGVGSLSLYRGKLEALLSMPADALTDILQMLIAGRFRYAVLEGTALRYRQGDVRMFRLDTKFEAGDLPPEED